MIVTIEIKVEIDLDETPKSEIESLVSDFEECVGRRSLDLYDSEITDWEE